MDFSTSELNPVPAGGVDSLSIPTIVDQPCGPGHSVGDSPPHDLKRKTAHGAMISMAAQGAAFFIRIVSMLLLARLLAPKDFGLAGMATAYTGFLALFQDVGLSFATIQRPTISHAQASTLFWINMAAGVTLAAICTITAPILTRFYHEPRLFWVTAFIATSFVLNGASGMHRAMLQRDLRFTALITIDLISLIASVVCGVGMALAGLGYWALVGSGVCAPAVTLIGVWLVGRWIPGLPRRGIGVGSMFGFGGAAMLNNVLTYIAYNADKVLLGRVWGAQTLGVYARAFQLINVPNQTFNTIFAQVAFPALSRIQNDADRFKSYFLKGYGLLLCILIPIAVACAMFAEDIVRVFLGAQWSESVPVFRFLAPTTLAFALINPFNSLMFATGRAMRSLKIGLVIAPVVFVGYGVGVTGGPTGVALGFSVSLALVVVPMAVWATRGTGITIVETFMAAARPMIAILVGAGATLVVWNFTQPLGLPIFRLAVRTAILFGVYSVVLWFIIDDRQFYVGLFREIVLRPLALARSGSRRSESVPSTAVGADDTGC
jgi:O-antigen/teichoic acid export membrane protein